MFFYHPLVNSLERTAEFMDVYFPEAKSMAHGVERMEKEAERMGQGAESLEKSVGAVSSPRFQNIGNSERGEDTASTMSAEQTAMREMKKLLRSRHYA